MDRRTRAERELEYRHAEVTRLRERIADHEREIAKLQGFIAVWDELSEVNDGEGERKTFTEDTTLIEATTTVLRRASGPLKAREIASRMLAAGLPYDYDEDQLVRSLRGILARYTRRGDLVKSGHGRYWVPRPDEEEETDQPSLVPVE